MEQFDLSERRACKLVEFDRSSYRYEPRAEHNAELREELVVPVKDLPGVRIAQVRRSRNGRSISVLNSPPAKTGFSCLVKSSRLLPPRCWQRLVRGFSA